MLERRLFRWPFVLTRTFTLDRAPAHMMTVILQTSSGAVQGEDRLLQRFHVRKSAAAHVTNQGASAVHRAGPGLISQEHIAIRVEQGGLLEFLPEPRILFPDAALEQSIEIDCAPGGTALVSDAFTIHDPEGRDRDFRRFVSTTILRRSGGDPVLMDRMDLHGLGGGRMARFKAFGAVVLAAPTADGLDILADRLTAGFPAVLGLYGAASLLPGGEAGIAIRLASHDLRAITAGIRSVWTSARRLLYGAPPPGRRKTEDC